jgi:hypothetical protein
MLESSLQSKYIKKLKEAGWFVTKLMKTSTNGIPDTLCIKNGRVVFVEYKRPGYKTSPLQDYVIDKIRKEGLEVVVADSWSSLKHLV